MSFHISAEDIKVQGGNLTARLRNAKGDFVDAKINLDTIIGNHNGVFQWEGENFSETAEDISFSIEGDGDVPVLRANLKNEEGVLQPADLNLGERIENLDGEFVFI